MMFSRIKLREFIETIIALDNRRRDELRLEDKRHVTDQFAALDKALQLQAKAYPTVKDFNDLKTHVDVELASRSGSSNAMTTLFQVLTVACILATAILGYLVYAAK